MKKVVNIILIVCIIVSFTGCAEKEIPQKINLPNEKEVYAVQIGSFKTKTEKFGNMRLQSLFKDIGKIKPIEKKDIGKIKCGEKQARDYTSVVFHYQKNKAEAFYFFKHNKKWYLETKDGYVYQNAEFINKIVSYSDDSQSNSTNLADIELSIPSEKILKLVKDSKELDIKYEFANSVQNYIESGLSTKEAISQTKSALLSDEYRYQYAVKNGYKLSEQKINEMKKQEEKVDKSANNFNELEVAYKSAGFTYDDYLQKERNIDVKYDTISALTDTIQKQFYDGKADRVGTKECWSEEEYWNTYLLNVIMPTSRKYNMDGFKKQLKQAEVYYKKNF